MDYTKEDQASSTDPPIPDPAITSSFLVKSLVAGGIAGMVAKTVVAPLDRLKILLQAQNAKYKHLGICSGIAKIIKREGPASLFRGNGAQMVRIFPYSAIQFTSFEFYKTFLPNLLKIKENEAQHAIKFASGSLAGVTAVIFTFPLDLIRTRLAFQTLDDLRYNGIIDAGRTISLEEGGVRGLYRGLLATVLGMIPYAGFAFYSFEMGKSLCMKFFPDITCKRRIPESKEWQINHHKPDGEPEEVLVLKVPFKLLCGGLAGAMGQTFSYPLDVVRRRMQLALMHPETEKFATGTWSTLLLIWKEDGLFKGLFRGVSINYIRAVPMVALSFSTNEILKQYFEIDTGMKFKS